MSKLCDSFSHSESALIGTSLNGHRPSSLSITFASIAIRSPCSNSEDRLHPPLVNLRGEAFLLLHVLQKPRKFVNASQHYVESRNFLKNFAYSLCKCLN